MMIEIELTPEQIAEALSNLTDEELLRVFTRTKLNVNTWLTLFYAPGLTRCGPRVGTDVEVPRTT